MLWVWLGMAAASGGLTWWAHWLAGRPGTQGPLRVLRHAPGLAWILSVSAAALFTWRAWKAPAEVEAAQKSLVLARNIGRAMDATLAGCAVLLALAILLGWLTLRRKRNAEK